MMQRSILSAILSIAISFLAARPAAGADEPDLTAPAGGTRILIVTGIDYPGHLWKKTAPAIKELLEKDPRFKVRVVEDPNLLASPKIHEWDVILLHFMNWEKPGPAEAARDNFKKFVASGKGVVSVHFACGAWQEWPEFQQIIGRVWGGTKVRQHDPYGKFTVNIVDHDHPITKGLKDFETTDELYTCLVGETEIHLLATANSKVDKKDYPMAFTVNYGKGRVFLTTLGHDVNAYTNGSVPEFLRRACAWAGGL